jgi:tRNA-dihydrouridine synthase 1
MKGHLFKLMRPGLARELDLRDMLGKIKGDDPVDEYLEVVEEMKRRMDVRVDEINAVCESPLIDVLLQRDMKEAEGVPIEQLITVDPTLGIKILPHWLSSAILASISPHSYVGLSSTVDARFN